MRVWLLGRGGTLGHALAAHGGSQVELVTTGREVDVTNASHIAEFAQELKPQWIVNAAAYTRVDDAEREESAAHAVNAEGPQYLAAAARSVGAGLVHVSTDYVFDGCAQSPYDEAAPCAPLNVYGRTKRFGEQRVLRAIEEGLAGYLVRTSWLFGERGTHFVGTMMRLMAECDVLRVVCDQWGRPTYARDLASAIWTLVERRAPFGTYHFSNAGVTTWHRLALRILEGVRELGLPVRTERIEPISSAELSHLAPRPKYSVLATERYVAAVGVAPRPWEIALREHLGTIHKRQK